MASTICYLLFLASTCFLFVSVLDRCLGSSLRTYVLRRHTKSRIMSEIMLFSSNFSRFYASLGVVQLRKFLLVVRAFLWAQKFVNHIAKFDSPVTETLRNYMSFLRILSYFGERSALVSPTELYFFQTHLSRLSLASKLNRPEMNDTNSETHKITP